MEYFGDQDNQQKPKATHLVALVYILCIPLTKIPLFFHCPERTQQHKIALFCAAHWEAIDHPRTFPSVLREVETLDSAFFAVHYSTIIGHKPRSVLTQLLLWCFLLGVSAIVRGRVWNGELCNKMVVSFARSERFFLAIGNSDPSL